MKSRSLRFLLLSFGLTWSIEGMAAFCGVSVDSGTPFLLVAATGMLMPATAAIICLRVFDRAAWSEVGLVWRGIRWKHMAYTVLLGISIMPLMLLVQHILGDRFELADLGHVSFTHERMATSFTDLLRTQGMEVGALVDKGLSGLSPLAFVGMSLALAIVAACSVNLPFMLGEELGWRGYLHNCWGHWPGWKRVLCIGPIWGLWHAPIILMGHNYPRHRVEGVFLMVVFCTLAAWLFDWSRVRSASVWGPSVLHGLINGTAGTFMIFAWGGHPLVASPTGVVGFIALACLGLLLLVCDGRYRRSFFRAPVPMQTS